MKVILCVVFLLYVGVVYAAEYKDFSSVGKLDMETYPIVYNQAKKSGDYNYLKILDKYLDGAIDGIITVLGDECKSSVTSKDIRSLLFALNNDGYGKTSDLRSAVFFAVVSECDINLAEKLKIKSNNVKKQTK